jgi:hypothetical protein
MKSSRVTPALLAGILAAGLAFSAPALADTFTLNTNEGDGYVIDLPNGADLFGSNSGFEDGVLTTYTATANSNRTFSINWTYNTQDDDPHYDPAGFYLNGGFFQLSDNGGPNTQTGFTVFSVLLGDVYGIYVDSIDDIGGRADLAVNVSESPLPAALPLFASGLGGLGGLSLLARRRKRKATVN